jgi:ABC-2 type transport system ATP-binding protein
MIQVEQLCRRFGSRTALGGISFSLGAGEAVVLTGPNGSGKTTLLRILATFLPATSGYVRVADCDPLYDSMELREATGYVPESAPLYNDMRATEFLRFRGRLRGLRGRSLRRRSEAAMEQCDLVPVRHAMIASLSRGQRVRLCLADALLNEPQVLLIDDPLGSLDREQRTKFVDTIGALRGSTTILVSTHLPEELVEVCPRRLTLCAGRLEYDGPAQGGDDA